MKKTWVKECWEYHSQHVSELDVAVDWGDWESDSSMCWCCGHRGKLQKCHIIPRSLGGSEKPENIVPLCAQCHDDAPDVQDKEFMFQWIKQNQNGLSGLGAGRYYHLVDLFVARTAGMPFDPVKFKDCLRKAYSLTSFHFSQSNAGMKMKRSTREWVFNKAFDMYESNTSLS